MVRADGGEMHIMARCWWEKVAKIGGVEHYEIVETHPGAFFENSASSATFLPKTSVWCWRITSPWDFQEMKRSTSVSPC